MLAWGVVPNAGHIAETITLDEVRQVLERALLLLERKGFDRREILPYSFITPACGTGTLPVTVAERVMNLTRQLSESVRQEYGLTD